MENTTDNQGLQQQMQQLLRCAVDSGQTDIVNILIDRGAIPAAEDHLLHRAVQRGDAGMVEALLKVISADDCDDDGRTASDLTDDEDLLGLFKAAPRGRRNALVKSGTSVSEVGAAELIKVGGVQKADQSTGGFGTANNAAPVVMLKDDKLSSAFRSLKGRFDSHEYTLKALQAGEKVAEDGSIEIITDRGNFNTSKRFITSLARMMKFSDSIFKLFTPQEVFTRIANHHPDLHLRVVVDRDKDEFLGVTEADRH